jgi:site-specific DNA-methyltransferase (adenine-specific)
VTLNNSLYSSDKSEWETPHELFDALNDEFQFILDPCCLVETAKCPLYYTPSVDGLKLPWFGNVFMNPPYGRTIKNWMKKAYESSQNGTLVVCLVPARVDTKWWHDYAMKAAEIRFTTRRLTFQNAGNKAPFPVAIVIFKQGTHVPILRVQQT